MKKALVLLFLLFVSLFADNSLDALLENLAQKDDLSNQTKKESAGYLIVYTRDDLDKMKVHSLVELIDQIPFIRYNENSGGFSDPYYAPYQPSTTSGIKVFIDDRDVTSPYNGNGLQVLGQLGLEYIDHIEIYMAIPSQTFGLSPSIITIKCYTKNPKRENTNVLGASYGSYNKSRTYVYSAQELDNFSYLIYGSIDNINRKKINFNNSTLSRDKYIKNIYAKITKDNLKWDTQIAKVNLDSFMGQSYAIDPIDPHVDVDYFYTGIYYNDKINGIKSYINYTYDNSSIYDNSKIILGVYPTSTPPFYQIYNTSYTKIKEHLSDMQFYKTFKSKNHKLILGLQGRYKKFSFDEIKLGSVDFPTNFNYNQEITVSLSAEENYMINRSNLITTSILYDKYYENSDVANYNTLSFRFGYIYNKNHFTSKSFIFYGENIPTMKTLYDNRAKYHQTSDPKKTKISAISTKLIYKNKNQKHSLLIGHTITKNNLYFTGLKYDNTKDDYIVDILSYRYTYNFNVFNRVIFNSWIDFIYNKNIQTNRRYKLYGGLVTLFNKIGKFNLYNNIVYKKWGGGLSAEVNLNTTITYNLSKDLTFYIKGNNLLDQSLETNYYRINPLTNTITYLDGVETIDRSIVVGLEYQF